MHPNILGYFQQINCYSLLKWTIFKAANGGERPWGIYAPLQRMHRELKYYSPKFCYNILMRCISQCAKYELCIIEQTEISSVWNLRKRHEFVKNIACFWFPFLIFSLIFYGHIILRSYSFFSHFNTYQVVAETYLTPVGSGIWPKSPNKGRVFITDVLYTLTTFWKQTTSTIPIWYKYALSVLSLANSSIILKISSSNSIHILYMYIYNHSYQKVG